MESHQYKSKVHPDCPLIEIDDDTEHYIINFWEYSKDMGVSFEQAKKDLTIKEIVECKDCKRSGTDGENTFCMWLGALRRPNDFCSYGERRTDE